MAWVQGLAPIRDLIQTLADLFEQGGWEVVDDTELPTQFVAKTATDPEGAIRAPRALKAELTGEAAGGGGFTGGTTYHYAVTAEGPKGESVASQELEITQPATPERVRITWRHVDGALRYHIYRRHGTGDLLRVGTTASQCNMFTDDGAEPQAGATPPEGKSLTMYLRLRRQATSRYEIMAQAGDDYTTTLANACPEFPVSYWSRNLTSLSDDHKVLYFGSINRNRAALVLYGDPTIDFSAYRVGFLYAGRMVPFPETGEDVDGNWVTFGSALTDFDAQPTTYGPYTANGIDNVAVYRTKTGVLWQRHELAFVTQRSQMQLEDKGFNPSQWTEKYHLSPVYVVHGYDGYRGWLEDVLAVQAHNVVHLDEFILSYPDGAEERYKYLHLNPADKSPFRRASPNTNYSIAILKE